MTRHAIALLVLSIIAIAGWAYNVNYNTKTALQRVSDLRVKIGAEREALRVLRVEWAYLNAPDRLARLVSEHNHHLGLVAMPPASFGLTAAVPYPPNTPDMEAREEAFAGLYPKTGGGVPVPQARPVAWSGQ